jgi:hypothetical protein
LEKRGSLRPHVVREQDRRFDDPAEEAFALQTFLCAAEAASGRSPDTPAVARLY